MRRHDEYGDASESEAANASAMAEQVERYESR
jgi:hypothetical protein